jgi:hypothetical protein
VLKLHRVLRLHRVLKRHQEDSPPKAEIRLLHRNRAAMQAQLPPAILSTAGTMDRTIFRSDIYINW